MLATKRHEVSKIEPDKVNAVQRKPEETSPLHINPLWHRFATHVPGVQAKLKIGQPGDQYEQEADRVAEQVMRMPEPQVQRCSALGCNEKDENRFLQAKFVGSFGAAQVDYSRINNVISSPGQPLDAATRSFMEPRFGKDFSGVRVHTDGLAAESARAVNARAYTVGRDVVFGAGQYSPGSDEGKRLMAHELGHVGQQTSPSVSHSNTMRIDRQPAGPDTAVEENEASGDELAKDVLAGTLVTQITISLARKRVGFHTAPGIIMGDVTKIDLDAGTYTLVPEPDKQKWVIEKEGVKVGLRFDVTLNGANPWTLSYPDKLTLIITSGFLEEPKTYGDMFNSKGEMIDPLWFYEDMPEEMKPKPIAGIDDFESINYDLHYRSQAGNLSKWLMVHYRDNTKRDINLDTITESTPRLWAAKQEALKVMDDYNALFILNAFPAVLFILTIQPMAPAPAAQPRYSASRTSIPKVRRFSSSKSGGSGSKEAAGEPPVSAEPAEVAVPLNRSTLIFGGSGKNSGTVDLYFYGDLTNIKHFKSPASYPRLTNYEFGRSRTDVAKNTGTCNRTSLKFRYKITVDRTFLHENFRSNDRYPYTEYGTAKKVEIPVEYFEYLGPIKPD